MECMEACTKAVGERWTLVGTIVLSSTPYDKWDLSLTSRRMAHYYSVCLATFVMLDASLWVHVSV